jgi:hypothetical protein
MIPAEESKEILAEVFGIDISDVDEMIQNRFAEEKSTDGEHETELWPVEFPPGRLIRQNIIPCKHCTHYHAVQKFLQVFLRNTAMPFKILQGCCNVR